MDIIAPDCSICLEPLLTELSVVVQCGHVFHSTCLNSHVDRCFGKACLCPSCRASMSKSSGHIKLFLDLQRPYEAVDSLNSDEDTDSQLVPKLKQRLNMKEKLLSDLSTSQEQLQQQMDELIETNQQLQQQCLEFKEKSIETNSKKRKLVTDNCNLRSELQKAKRERSRLLEEVTAHKEITSAIDYFKDPKTSTLFGSFHSSPAEATLSSITDVSTLKKMIRQQHIAQKLYKQEYQKLQQKTRSLETKIALLKRRHQPSQKSKNPFVSSIDAESNSNSSSTTTFDVKSKDKLTVEPDENSNPITNIIKPENNRVNKTIPKASARSLTESFNPFARSGKSTRNPFRGPPMKRSGDDGRVIRSGYDELGRKRQFRMR